MYQYISNIYQHSGGVRWGVVNGPGFVGNGRVKEKVNVYRLTDVVSVIESKDTVASQ
jgi:hypothetical protein